MKMKKTEYTVMVTSNQVVKSTWKRVWKDERGKHYVKEKGTYKCIENTPCINMMVKD